MKGRSLVAFALLASFCLLLPNGTISTAAQAPRFPALSASAGASVQQLSMGEIVGQVGGRIHSLAVQGNYAYVGVGPRLVTLDVSDPASPTVVGRSGVLPGVIYAVAQAGNYAYVGGNHAGLCTIDVSNPASPFRVACLQTAGETHGLEVRADYAYLAQWGVPGAGLHIVNIADPAHPNLVGSFATNVSAHDVALAGDYAYVAAGDVQIVDVSLPTSPSAVGSLDLATNSARGIAVAGSYAYLAATYDGLYVVDVSQPLTPTVVAGYDTEGTASDVALGGDYAFVADHRGLCILDVAQPLTPTEVSYLDAPGPATDVVLAGGYAYMPQADQYAMLPFSGHGLSIASVADPANPSLAGFYETMGWAHSVRVAGGYAYVGESDGLRIVKLLNGVSPVEVGFCPTSGWILDVEVVDGLAFLADRATGLRIVDVSDPVHPYEISHYTTGCAAGVEVAGNYAYVASGECYNSFFWVIDVAVSMTPTLAAVVQKPALDVALSGDLAYVSGTGEDGLMVFDISEPLTPTQVGHYWHAFHLFDEVAVSGDFLYLSNPKLLLLDVTNPITPAPLGTSPVYPTEVEARGPYAYFAGSGGTEWPHDGVGIVSFLVPDQDYVVAAKQLPGDSAYGLYVVEPYVYVADGDGGLILLGAVPSARTAIPPTGGTLVSGLDGTTYTFPAGAFTDTVIITHTPILPLQAPSSGQWSGIGHFFELTAVYSSTGQPAQLAAGRTFTVTVQYSDAEKRSAIENTLALYGWDESAGLWSQEGITSSVNVAMNLVTAQSNHCSAFAVLGETRRVFLPVVVKH